MSKPNIDNIMRITNTKIGYANYEREELMKKNKMKKVLYAFMGVSILTVSTVSVNALTDNSIGKAIDETINNLVKVKVNGEDYNSTCTNNSDGSVSCKVGDTGTEYIIYEDGKGYNYSFDITEDGNTVTQEIEISDKKDN